ncbi:MAG: T9SS type A sorting domain-containing protein [bacterium]
MKKMILFMALVIWFHSSEIFSNQKNNNAKESKQDISKADSYAENVHMYICIEALKLLKDRFPNLNFSQIENRIGTMQDIGTRPWQVGKITTGAYREDIEDVVFDIRGPFGLEASCSHFWNADDRENGDHTLTHLEVFGNFPNAYTKITKAINGQWNKWSNGYQQRLYINYLNPSNGLIYRYSYHTRGFINFFKTKKIFFHSYVNTLGQEITVDEEITLDDYRFNKIVWEELGRMAHLIQDLSVPAHVHNDVHLPPPVPNDFDCYHEYIDNAGYLNFDWQTAKNSGGFINPYEFANEPVRYLMYVTTQLADHYPSGPGCLDIPQQHAGNNNLPGGSYPMITDYYSGLGAPPSNISSPYIEGTYCFNHAIRATAGLMYWFAVETGIIRADSLSLPVINSFSKNLPDNVIYHGERLILSCDATGSNLNYNWFYKVCRPDNICSIPVNGLLFNGVSNSYCISNTSFNNRWTCLYYDSICNITSNNNSSFSEPPLNLVVGVRVSNKWGAVTEYFDFNPQNRFYPNSALRPPPPPPISGCPVLRTNNGEQFIIENDILKESEFKTNLKKDVSDKLLLNTIPYIDPSDNLISLAISETSIDEDFFDKVGLYCVDHPDNTTVGVTESKDIVLYDKDKLRSPEYAVKSGVDVTKQLGYDSLFEISVKGEEKEILSVVFSSNKTLLRNITEDEKEDSFALIFDVSFPIDSPRVPVAKDFAGSFTFSDISGNYYENPIEFAGRVKRSELIVTVPSKNEIAKAELTWNKGFDISYITAAIIHYGGFDLEELKLIKAENSLQGNIDKQILYDDDVRSEMDSNSYIVMKFTAPKNELPPGWKRDFVFEVNGHYLKSNWNYESLTNLRNNPDAKAFYKSELKQNFPNPFNPLTIINYECSVTGLVRIKVYDVIGQEISTLVNENKVEGKYQVEFDGSDFSNGIYFYRMEIDGQVKDTKRMILLK